MRDISIQIYFVKAVLKKAADHGLKVEQLLRRSGISPRLLAEPQARVSPEQFAKLQAITMREMGDEMLGYCAQPLKIGQWSALCHWLIHCRTLGQVLKRYCLFYDILGKGLQASLATDADKATISLSPWGNEAADLEPYAYELFTFSLHRQLCWLVEKNLTLEQVTLPYPEPEHISEYRALYLGAPVAFNAPHCTLVFKRHRLSMPVKQTPDSLAEFLRKSLYHILINNYHNRSWTQQVKNVIGDDLSLLPTFAQIAEKLDLKPKQLQRHLQDEGLSYGELKLQLRRDMAIYYLARRNTSVEEIAYKTGFSEPSAFIRAFKKWTGVTPLTYRKDLAL